MRNIEEVLGYRFRCVELLEEACRHASVTENRSSNERLEFLGDAVLSLVVAEEFYLQKPPLDEGAMTQMRALVVSGEALAESAKRHQLHLFLKVGKNMTDISERVIAGFVEALIAAVYLDGGLDAARMLIKRLLGERIRTVLSLSTRKDHKSLLQEWSLRKCGCLPTYRLLQEDGPPHHRHYRVEVVLCGKTFPPGDGKSKKEAEQQAAFNALISLGIMQEKRDGDT